MPAARPLRDVFTELTGEGVAGVGAGTQPDELLRAQGHESLGDALVAEAVVNFADSAPVEVAEHLARFVMAHSPVPLFEPAPAGEEALGWADLLASAPSAADLPGLADDADLDALGAVDHPLDAGHALHPLDAGLDVDHGLVLDFGLGEAEIGTPLDLADDADTGAHEAIGTAGDEELGDVGLTVYSGHPADLDGFAPVADDDGGDDADGGDDGDPADTIDA